MRRLLVIATLVFLSLCSPAIASNQHPTQREIEQRVMCPTCGTTVDRSDSPAAQRMRSYIRSHIKQGWTRTEILDGIVDEYGGDRSILVASPGSGTGTAIWMVPIAVLVIACMIGAMMVRSWRKRGREQAQ